MVPPSNRNKTRLEKEKQATQENRLKLEALPEWKKELFLKSHLGLLN